MRASKIVALLGVVVMAVTSPVQAIVTHLSDELTSKTGWTAVQATDSDYVVGTDPYHSLTGHSSITTAISQRQKFLTSPVDISMTPSFTQTFRVLLHPTIAAVNEAVARVGIFDSGSAPAAGQLSNAFVTLRRAGAIELGVERRTDGIGGTESILSTSATMPTSNEFGIGGGEYADWTVTRNSAGQWTVSVLNAYGNTVLTFGGTESTVASTSILDKVWIQDLGGQWDGSETAAYWDSIGVTSIPEPAGLMVLGLGALGLLRARRRA